MFGNGNISAATDNSLILKKMENSDLPGNLGAPATSGLHKAAIFTLNQLSSCTEEEIAGLHGIGRNAIEKLRKALSEKGLQFSKKKTQS